MQHVHRIYIKDVFWLHVVGGHLVTDSSCCKTGAGDGELCVPDSSPCSSPRQYVFWDGLHTTDAWNEIVAKSAYDSMTPLEAFPFNISKLARL
ncbi:hypothetical protein HRI_001089600 [Hibiscus trionum]|uniref:GDSL esterase/lipase n=1 Tax=Hibiscus trionum TaxID=183268 RepID=A0A9W7HBF8_HIBTR|nr:hypothetical protein HRI_001089600 [Hibiscus trionum]